MLSLILAIAMAAQSGDPEVGSGFHGCATDAELQLALDPRPRTTIPGNVVASEPRYVVRCVRRRIDGPIQCPRARACWRTPGATAALPQAVAAVLLSS
ncbi:MULTISPECIES: hypothetical protein [unclassified Sphingomonas]|uniref:hypothetical protein n=1 Tax=unclassified Sphingomonas TaxID=196159 RepID=UPI002151DF4E|nr:MULTISPECIES: hypothetical protein [unclassified Sphingomonas]MCR5871215.1 hypothetical protein [Sphingomonas sp. J344]UUY00475.1 hypothetical protein LRS08_05070 [Sphingomonas sp. J315]